MHSFTLLLFYSSTSKLIPTLHAHNHPPSKPPSSYIDFPSTRPLE